MPIVDLDAGQDSAVVTAGEGEYRERDETADGSADR
jgi:hypothetical protein